MRPTLSALSKPPAGVASLYPDSGDPAQEFALMVFELKRGKIQVRLVAIGISMWSVFEITEHQDKDASWWAALPREYRATAHRSRTPTARTAGRNFDAPTGRLPSTANPSRPSNLYRWQDDGHRSRPAVRRRRLDQEVDRSRCAYLDRSGRARHAQQLD
jgi:hypothetical protein